MCLYPSDKKSDMYINGDAYTDVLNFIWYDFVCKADLIFDLGANYGQFVLNSISKESAQGIEAAYCFEPNPKVAKALNESIRRSRLNNTVKVIPLGVSNEAGEFDFFINLHSSGGSSLDSHLAFNPLDGIYQLPIKVQTTRLDKFIEHEELSVEGKNIALKIDVEGNDFPAYEGALALLSSANEFLLIMETGKISADAFEKKNKDSELLAFFNRNYSYITYQKKLIEVEDFYDYFLHFQNTTGNIDIIVSTRALDLTHFLRLAKDARESKSNRLTK